VHSVPLSSLKVGDVITYTNLAKRGTTITHRIIKIYKINGRVPVFITKGDANPIPDVPIVGALVRGKTVWHTPKLGAWLNTTKKPYILLPLVYIPALFIVVDEIRRLNEYYKKRQPYILAGYTRAKLHNDRKHPIIAESLKFTGVAIFTFVIISTVRAHALLRSNVVSLKPNHLTAAKVIKPPTCTSTGDSTNISITGTGGINTTNNVNVSNSNNQSGSSGNVTNTGGGSSTSGSVNNSNCTNINVNITNGH